MSLSLSLSFQALIAQLMILGGNIEGLIDFFSFTVWIFYGMSMLALLVLRKNKPDIARPYKVVKQKVPLRYL